MESFTLDKLPARVLRELDVETAYIASRAVIAAERFQLFRLLHTAPCAANRIARRLGLSVEACERFLKALQALGLIRKRGAQYANSSLAEKYFIGERSIHWTRQYSRECVEDYQRFAPLEEILRNRRSDPRTDTKGKPEYVVAMERDPARARDFTLMLYHYHQPDAARLARVLDLTSFHSLLDVGGGSGVMSMALLRNNPQLHATVFDIAPVCKVARQVIRGEGLSKRITTRAGNIKEPFPSGYDVILFCDLGAISGSMIANAHRALPSGGMLAIVDNFLSDDGTRPLENALYGLLGTKSGLQTRREIVAALKKSGFRKVRHQGVYQDVEVVTALK